MQLSVCILAVDPSHPIVSTSTEISKKLFTASKLGPNLEFKKELGLGFWSVWKHKEIVGWIQGVTLIKEF